MCEVKNCGEEEREDSERERKRETEKRILLKVNIIVRSLQDIVGLSQELEIAANGVQRK